MGRMRDEDKALWEAVKKTVTPLKPASKNRSGAKGLKGLLAASSDTGKRGTEKSGHSAASPPESTAPSPKSLKLGASAIPARSGKAAVFTPHSVTEQPLDRTERRKVARGKQAIDARLDLHGMTQARAKDALRLFIIESHRRKLRVVLIITGKGGAKTAGGTPWQDREAPGVLKRNVPVWLRSPELSPMIVGFEPSARHHGGEGALYVRLRRKN